MDCLICFCPIEGQIYSCADPQCKSSTCLECTEALITHSLVSELIPNCISTKCQSFYILSGLKGISSQIQNQYYQASLAYMLKDRGEGVQKKMEQEKILAKLRAERMKFIQETFPAAISLVANLTFDTKIRRLEKQRSIKIADDLRAANRSCMNLYCNGFLDEKLVCMTCHTSFCLQCEKLLTSDHKCRPEDIESISVIKDMIHCPQCQLPVFKDVGCDSITCSNCGQLFKYSTGEKGGHGSINAPIKLETKRKLSFMYREQLEKLHGGSLLERLLEIESMEPSKISGSGINKGLKHFYKENDRIKAGREIARNFDKMMVSKYKIRRYQHTLGEIENLLIKRKLTLEHMDQLIAEL